jgi:hypothetical protein
MLYQAIKAQATFAPWTPFTQYTQAAPIIPALIWKAIITQFGLNGLLLRLPSLLASVGGLWVLWLALRTRLSAVGAGAGLLLPAFSATAILQSAQLKPYSFEFLAAALLVRAAIQLAIAPNDSRAVVRFAVLSLASLAFTYTSPVVTASCGCGILASIATTQNLSKKEFQHLVSWGLLWAIATAAWQFYVVDPSTHLQFAGNERDYAWEYVVLGRPGTWHHVGRILNVLDPAGPNFSLSRAFTAVACLVWVAGIGVGWRHRKFEHTTLLAALSLLTVLSLSHYFPFASQGSFYF